MNDIETKIDEDRSDEARMLATLCARANATRRATIGVRMGDSVSELSRTPRRLLATS
jgi:hypothetical protein